MRQKTLKIHIEEGVASAISKPFTLGEHVMLVEKQNESTGKSWYTLLRSEAISGNLDPSKKRYHGWRGTTNGISVYAHGLREVIRADEPVEATDDFGFYQRVTVGKDLNPKEA